MADLTSLPKNPINVERALIDEISIPFLYTTSNSVKPTMLLLFVHPQRVPPLRRTFVMAPGLIAGIGARASRSSEGAFVDGVRLRVADPRAAVARLHSAGAELVTDPNAWLGARREKASDPLLQEKLARIVSAATWMRRGGLALWLGAWLALLWVRSSSGFDSAALYALVAVALIGMALEAFGRRFARRKRVELRGRVKR